jgi:hypothetical protein
LEQREKSAHSGGGFIGWGMENPLYSDVSAPSCASLTRPKPDLQRAHSFILVNLGGKTVGRSGFFGTKYRSAARPYVNIITNP